MFVEEKSLKDLKYAGWIILLLMTGFTAWGIVVFHPVVAIGGLLSILLLFAFVIFADKRLRKAVKKRIAEENTRKININIDTVNEGNNVQFNNDNPNYPPLHIPSPNSMTSPVPVNSVVQGDPHIHNSPSPVHPQSQQGQRGTSAPNPMVSGNLHMNNQPQQQVQPQPVFTRFYGPSIAVVIDREDVLVFGPFRSTDEAFAWEPGARVLFKKMMSGQDDVIMQGEVKALPIGSPEAKHYVEKAGEIILPTSKEWDFIKN